MLKSVVKCSLKENVKSEIWKIRMLGAGAGDCLESVPVYKTDREKRLKRSQCKR